MWYFAWILGVLLACAFGIINVLWLEAQESLEQESVVLDPLTKALIRFEFLSILEEKINQRQIDNQPFCLLMMSLDPLSENPGSLTGDDANQILLDYSEIIRGVLRDRSDILARYDAATFALLLANTNVEGAETVAERLCKDTQSRLESSFEGSLISIGITECSCDLLTNSGNDIQVALKTLLRTVDNAMKEARSQGRDRYATSLIHQS